MCIFCLYFMRIAFGMWINEPLRTEANIFRSHLKCELQRSISQHFFSFFFSFIARSTYPFKITFVCVTSSSPVFERILCYIFMRLPLCFCKSSVNKLTHKVYLQFASNSMLVARFVFTKHFESIVPNADDEPLNH